MVTSKLVSMTPSFVDEVSKIIKLLLVWRTWARNMNLVEACHPPSKVMPPTARATIMDVPAILEIEFRNGNG
jgi:hypothetical protein